MLCNISCIIYICLTSIGTPIPGTALGIATIANSKVNTYNSYPKGPPHLMSHRPCLGFKEAAFQVQKPTSHLSLAAGNLRQARGRVSQPGTLEHGCQATVHTGLSHPGLHLLPFVSPGPWSQTTAPRLSPKHRGEGRKAPGRMHRERAGGYRKWKQQDVAYLSPPSSA